MKFAFIFLFLIFSSIPSFGQVTWKSPGTYKCRNVLKKSNGHNWPIQADLSKILLENISGKCGQMVEWASSEDVDITIIHHNYEFKEIERWEGYPGTSISREANFAWEAILADIIGIIGRKAPRAVSGAIGGISGNVWGDAWQRYQRYPDLYIKYSLEIITYESVPDGPPEGLELSNGQSYHPRACMRDKWIRTPLNFVLKFERGGVGPYRAYILGIDGHRLSKRIQADEYWQEALFLITARMQSEKLKSWTPFTESVVSERTWLRKMENGKCIN
jgi:hypothetical protein